jgi:methylmalonyl-CoA mutase C-terminal domain/subunit
VRVLLAKAGLDSHDRGVRYVARGLRDAGMEVVYTGLYRTVEEIAETAVQEDADIVGVSVLNGSHMAVFPPLREALDARGAADVPLIGGGVMSADDAAQLKQSGAMAEFFGPGTPLPAIVSWIQETWQGSPRRGGA